MKKKRVVITGIGVVAPNDIKQTTEQLGIQYVHQRRSFAKLITTVKQTALRYGFKATSA
jgi:hypothetical protein